MLFNLIFSSEHQWKFETAHWMFHLSTEIKWQGKVLETFVCSLNRPVLPSLPGSSVQMWVWNSGENKETSYQLLDTCCSPSTSGGMQEECNTCVFNDYISEDFYYSVCCSLTSAHALKVSLFWRRRKEKRPMVRTGTSECSHYCTLNTQEK